jgi:hypothetical protein
MKSDIIIQLHKNFEDYAHQIDGEGTNRVRHVTLQICAE